MVFYYKNGKDENCTLQMVPFFKDLSKQEKVTAYIWNNSSPTGGVEHKTLVDINNHLSTSNCWENVEDWIVSVEYTILHPEGDFTVSDTKCQDNPNMVRKLGLMHWNGGCKPDDSFNLRVIRCNNIPITSNKGINMKMYSFVRIKNTKTFTYRTGRSSWKYKLCVIWEGETKTEAENSEKRYEVCVESDNSEVCTSDPRYTSASFFEKILDVVSVSRDRQTLIMNV